MKRVALGKRLVVDEGYPESNPHGVSDAYMIDNCWKAYSQESPSATDPLLLDFADVSYLAHDTLLHIAALLSYREHLGVATVFELPSNSRVWQFLRSWRFPQMIEGITKKSFEACLTEQSKRIFWQDASRVSKYVRAISLPGGGEAELLLQTQFAVTAIRLDENPLKAATWAKDQWMDKHLLSVLDAYLNGDGDRVGGLVVLEAVLNAAMHPNASCAFISSQIVMPKSEQNSSAERMEISVWDDGLAIADTLLQRIRDGLHITSDAYGSLDETFEVRLVQDARTDYLQTVGPGIEGLDPTFPWLTVAAFLVGVTATPDRTANNTLSRSSSKYTNQVENSLSGGTAGRGLHYIRRNVLNLWGGEIRYSSGQYRFHMRATTRDNTYSVNIQHRPSDAWPLQGNNLTLSIPLGRKAQND